MRHFILILVCLLFIVPNLSAQKHNDYKKHPGYIDFGSLDDFKNAEETVEVLIKGPLLKFVARASAKDDPELAKLMNNLSVIKVNVFSIEDKETEKVKTIINRVSNKINLDKWERMVKVREKDEYVEVYTQFGDNDMLTGLVVMAVEDNDEAVFVNIAGDIDPEHLGKLSNKFNIPELDSLEIETKKKP